MTKHTPPPPGELRNVQVQFVSLVKKGANGRQFQIFKSADFEPEEEQPTKGLGDIVQAAVQKALQTLGLAAKSEEVEKAVEAVATNPEGAKTPPTFSATMEEKEQRDAIWSGLYVFEDVIREIIWSTATNKVDLVAQAIDDFKGYILPRVPAFNVQKADDEPDKEMMDGDIANIEEGIAYVNVAKAGRKISTGRLARLKEAHARLAEVITEAEGTQDDETTEVGEEIEVKKEDLMEVLKAALAPVEERLTALEGTTEEPKTEEPADNTAEIIKAALAEALAPVTERLAKVEKARGVSNAKPTETANVQKAGGFSWGGSILGE